VGGGGTGGSRGGEPLGQSRECDEIMGGWVFFPPRRVFSAPWPPRMEGSISAGVHVRWHGGTRKFVSTLCGLLRRPYDEFAQVPVKNGVCCRPCAGMQGPKETPRCRGGGGHAGPRGGNKTVATYVEGSKSTSKVRALSPARHTGPSTGMQGITASLEGCSCPQCCQG